MSDHTSRAAGEGGAGGTSPDLLLAVSDRLDRTFRESGSAAIRAMLSDRSLSRKAKTPAEGYERDLIFRDPFGRFGLWLFTWAPGSTTPIHDHHCLCLYGIHQGELEERIFSVTDAGGAAEVERTLRETGYLADGRSPAGQAHQLANPGPSVARSIHVYAFDPMERSDSLGRRYSGAGPTA